MEADWSVEVGPEMPVIDPLWPGLVDLLSSPQRISEIEEAAHFSPLAQALLRIHPKRNGEQEGSLEQEGNPEHEGSKDQEKSQQGSTGPHKLEAAATRPYAFWSAKCDLWELEDGAWDPDEMGAEADESQAAIACYIDLLPRTTSSPADPSATRLLFADWRDAEQAAKNLALSMRGQLLLCARADFIVRSAITAEQQGFGITVYLAACGTDSSAASRRLAFALEALTATLAEFPWPDFAANPIPLQ